MPPIITCAAALNPCFNVNGVDFLIESISTDLEFFDDTFASKASGGNKYSRLLNGLKAHTKKKARTDPTMSSEYERYVNSDFVTHLHPKEFASFNVLGFWKEKETMFPDHLNAKERKQDKCPLETPLDFEEGVFDDEVQQNEAIPLSDEEIALDASSEGTMSPGGPRYDYMLSSEAEDDY
ncbi:hypothetical protein Tco_1277665 [Tanacetum coccineum]